MADTKKRRMRKMYDWEIGEVQPVFGNSLNYDQVRVCEGYGFTDLTDRIGRFLKGQKQIEGSNSITLGNHCYFPIFLPENLPAVGSPESSNVDWMVHELTHAWQYQHTGVGYLFRALWAQFRYKDAAYEYGGSANLVARRAEGATIFSFNLEAQGEITRFFYINKLANRDVSAFLPYIQDVQNT